jgi:hypothetical protein
MSYIIGACIGYILFLLFRLLLYFIGEYREKKRKKKNGLDYGVYYKIKREDILDS